MIAYSNSYQEIILAFLILLTLKKKNPQRTDITLFAHRADGPDGTLLEQAACECKERERGPSAARAKPWQENRERAGCFRGVFGRFGAGVEKSSLAQRSEHLKSQSQASSY